MEKEFCLETYLQKNSHVEQEVKMGQMEKFHLVCQRILREFDKEWNETDDQAKHRKLEREKKAIMGYEAETRFYKEKIRELLSELKLQDSWYPSWYPDLTEGIFAELYGLSGLAPWVYDMEEKFKLSSSAKLIGSRIYCLIDGHIQLLPQRMTKRRREQLKRTLLLATPHERLEYGFHEVYLRNGVRITIYSGNRTKADQEVMVFRKYILERLTFEELAEKGTIPMEAIPLFMSMIQAGFNVLFAGQVRSGKTTFLQVWQSCENPELEGVAVATDPETPWHEIMPAVPVMQLIADGKALEDMMKSLLRGDNDYLLLEEMRDAAAFRLGLDMTSTGTKRCKGTIHDRDGLNIPYKMASKIREKYGGDEQELIAQVFKNFDYVIELCQLESDKRRKVMKGILEYHYDVKKNQVSCRRICKYDFQTGVWLWNLQGFHVKKEKYPETEAVIETAQLRLRQLWAENPMEDEIVFPGYYKENRYAD